MPSITQFKSILSIYIINHAGTIYSQCSQILTYLTGSVSRRAFPQLFTSFRIPAPWFLPYWLNHKQTSEVHNIFHIEFSGELPETTIPRGPQKIYAERHFYQIVP